MAARLVVNPSSVVLGAGETVDVVVSVDGDSKQEGKIFFPVRTLHGMSKGVLEISVDDVSGGAIFEDPENPQKLPVEIEKISETATTATFRIRALPMELTRSQKRELKKHH